VAHFIANAVEKDHLAGYTRVDGVLALGHESGCAAAADGAGLELLQRALAGYVRNPNFGGILLVGLGCEVNHIDCLLENMHLKVDSRLKTIGIQNAGGTAETVRLGIEAVKAMLPEVNRVERSPVSASHIKLGLECGGSDAYSGISANPALGKAVDMLVGNGGTAILSETPEIYGAEHLLTRRAVNQKIGQKLIDRIRWWEEYTAQHNAEINNNPTPGNKAGGLTTILEKSLGAIVKGGSTNLIDVYGYAEPVKSRGLVFMDTPGYDVVSITGMIAGGANMLCFTTGRGSVCGFKPVPTLKLASNSELYKRMRDDMDVNCGQIVDGKTGIEEMGETIFRLILDTASGKKSKSENFGFGDNEFVPWHIGAIL
jgi:altronate dehydratase